MSPPTASIDRDALNGKSARTASGRDWAESPSVVFWGDP
jgi:hypothetical protein